MNAANHGQCHRRRSSRDERPDHLKGEAAGEQPGVGHEAALGREQQLPPRQGEDNEHTPLLAEEARAPGSPAMRRAVVGQRGAARHTPRFRSGSWSGVTESEDGVWSSLCVHVLTWAPRPVA